MTVTSYTDFLARKRASAPAVGVAVRAGDVHPSLYDWQAEIVAWAASVGRAAVWADTGLGKAQPIDEPVLTPAGWVPIGALTVGDEVITANGGVTRVTGAYPQGERPIVTVRFNDGAAVRCDEDHLWLVATDLDLSRGRPWRALTVRQIVERGITDPNGRHRWRIPVARAVQHPQAELPIDPYVLGVLLGDGSFRRETGPTFTVADRAIAEEVDRRLPNGMRLARDPVRDRTPSYRPVQDRQAGSGGRTNPYLVALRAWGLHGLLAHEKFIPKEYLVGSAAQRLDLLRGLMDTDGYVSRAGTVQFGSSSPRLVDGVLALVRSLGGVARRSRKTPRYRHGGEARIGRPHETLTIAFPNDTQPFGLARKANRCIERCYSPQRKIVAVEASGAADVVCISVAHPSQLYVTRDYVVTHNTRMQVEWARLVAPDQPALIVAPLAVCDQTVREAASIGVDAAYVRDNSALAPGLWVTNYEMVERFDPSRLAAVVLDEASILKQSDGKTRSLLIRHFAGVPHRLACTATPAPNEPEELTNQAEFLGVMTRANMLAAYFVHDQDGWRPKGHARRPMFEWMASWALAIRRPSDMGYPDDGFDLPGLEIHEHLLPVDVEADGQLFATDLGGVSGRAAIRKATLDARCERAAAIVAREPNEPWLLWCGLNDEADLLAQLIPGARNVRGSMSPEEKARELRAFAAGDTQVLITKPSLAAFGLNWQHCARMAFVGLSDSYEAYYQAIRRCHRHGQKRTVDAHVVLSEIEGQIVQNIKRKEREAAATTAELVAAMRAAREPRIERSAA